ncbi:hypothetical protein V5799_022575 [Amblyomma americanum]|uniref:Uncharacterized protein n=1 Tax=Amblyomma americanum TaxID=6943 RepID=A0AAQ4FLH9_AMBAM
MESNIFFPPGARAAVRAVIACLDRSSENANDSLSALLEFLEERTREARAATAPPSVAALVEEVAYYAVNWMLPLLFNTALVAAHDAPRGRALVLFPSDLVTIWLKIVTEQRTHGTYDSLWKYLSRATSSHGTHFDLDAGADIAEDVLSTLDSIEFEAEVSVVVTVGKLGAALGLPPGEDLVKGFRRAFPVSPAIDVDDVVFVSHRKILGILASLITVHGARPLTEFVRWWVLLVVGFLSDSTFIREHADVREVSEVMTLVCTTETEATHGLALNTAHKERLDEDQLGSLRKALDNVKSTLVLSIDHLSYMSDRAKETMSDQLKDVRAELLGDVNAMRQDNGSVTLFGDLPDVEWPFLRYWVSARTRIRSLDSGVRYRLPYLQRRTVPATLVRYEPFSRRVVVSAAALAAPYYYAQGTKAMFYGGIGFLYAKALLQAIDYPPAVLKQCGPSGRLLRDEFPDMAAMEAAHAALQRDNDHYRLPKMETLDTDHVFFMTLCFGSCRASGKSRFSHSCNRAVMRSRMFAHVLRCQSQANLCHYF